MTIPSMQILAKYSNLERLHDLQNSDIYIGWAQCISNRLIKMASAEAKLRLGKTLLVQYNLKMFREFPDKKFGDFKVNTKRVARV